MLKYVKILGDYLSSLDILGEPIKDNSPCHCAIINQDWLKQKKINTMTWSAKSPDLNCIEILGSWLDQQLAKQQLLFKKDLSKTVTHRLNNIFKIIVHNLIDSILNRMDKCIRRK